MNAWNTNESASSAQATCEVAEREAIALAARLRRAEGKATLSEVRDLESKLEEVVRTALKRRLAMHKAELDAAQAMLDQSRKRLARRRELADKIVARRVSDLKMGDETSWEATSQPRSQGSTFAQNDLSVQGAVPQGAVPADGDLHQRDSYTSYQVFLRDSIGELKQRRDERLEGIAEIQQDLVDLQRIVSRPIDENSEFKEDQLEEKKRAEPMVKRTRLQIAALREEVESSDEKIKLLEKKLIDTRKGEADFAALSGTVSSVTGNRVELTIGSNQGIEKGMQLKIFRDELYIDAIQIVEVQPDSSIGVASGDRDHDPIRVGDVTTLLLDPRLPSIIGLEPGESIFNDQIKRFKFHLPSSAKGGAADIGQRFMRRYLGQGNPPIFGMWGDPATDSLVVIAPAQSETAIREFLIRGEVLSITGFEARGDGLTLENQMNELLRERSVAVARLAGSKLEIIEMEAASNPDADEMKKLLSEVQSRTSDLDVLDRKIAVIRELSDEKTETSPRPAEPADGSSGLR